MTSHPWADVGRLVGDLARLTARASANGCDVIASLPQTVPQHPIRFPVSLRALPRPTANR